MGLKPTKKDLIAVGQELYALIKPMKKELDKKGEETGKKVADKLPKDGTVKELLAWVTKAAGFLEEPGDEISQDTADFLMKYEIPFTAKVTKPKAKEKAAGKKKAAAKEKAKEKKAAAGKKATPAKGNGKKDEFGFPIPSPRHEFVKLLRKGPIKMADVKRKLGATFNDPWKVIVAKVGKKKAYKDENYQLILKK